MLKLNVYSGKDIQNMLAILVQVRNKKFNIDDTINFLANEIRNRRKFLNNGKQTMIQYETKEETIMCKSCGKGKMFPVVNYEGLPILACKQCRYSFIVKTEEDI